MSKPTVFVVGLFVPAAEADLASGLLWGAGVSAVGEELGADGMVKLTVDVPEGGVAAIDAAIGSRWPVNVAEVDDGSDGWRPFAQVVRAGQNLVVQPPWVLFEPSAGDVVLTIDPGRSFGHGAHPTTRLCLTEVERLVRSGSTVLDVGCGSGVLAIAAARLGSRRVVAVDIDPAAVDATEANAAANGVTVEILARPLAQVDGQFDLVLANIGSATLIDLAPTIESRVSSSGAVVISGLLSDRWQAAAEAFESFSFDCITEREGWVAVVLRRDRRAPGSRGAAA